MHDEPPSRAARSRYVELLRARWALSAALALAALGAFLKLTSELEEGELNRLDRALLARAIGLRVPHLNAAAIDLTALGSSTVLPLFVAIALLFLVVARDFRSSLQLLLTAAGAVLWTELLKRVLERDRPPPITRLVEVTGFSYPSGHSLAAASVYLTLALVATRHVPNSAARAISVALAAALALAIGASRAYLGVHYPSDILAGLSLGASWALAVSAVFSYLHARTN
jgi:undecaprenyl-diphosphatase